MSQVSEALGVTLLLLTLPLVVELAPSDARISVSLT